MQAFLHVVQITVEKCPQTFAQQQIEAHVERVEMLANGKIFILPAFQAF